MNDLFEKAGATLDNINPVYNTDIIKYMTTTIVFNRYRGYCGK